MDVEGEKNTLAAAAVFLGALVIDAFTSSEPFDGSEAPTSLRTTALVLLACLAAPPIRQYMVFEQRVVIGLILATVALVGWHETGSGGRVADAVYVCVCLGGMILTFWLGGFESAGADAKSKRRPKTHSVDAPPYTHRDMLANTAVATLFYSSFRLLRAALRAPDVARTFTVETTQYDGVVMRSVGYAFASSLATAANAFGSAAGIGVACVLMANKELREQGTSAVTLVLSTGGFAQLTGAFIATMAGSEHLVNLPAIWSQAGCADNEVCGAAFVARRLAVTAWCTSGLWINGFGTLLMAYAPTIRLRTRAQQNAAVTNFQIMVYASAGTLVCVVCLLSYLSFSGSEAYTDYVMVVAVIALPIATFLDPLVGALLFALSIGTDIVMMWSTYGGERVFGHFTHCCNACMILLMLLYVLVTGLIKVLWRYLPRDVVELLDVVSGLLAVCGTSIATVLYLGSAALYAAYDGQHIADTQYRAADNRYERTTAAFIAEHFLPLLIWLVLYSCRCEVELLSMRMRAIAWYCAPVIPGIIWGSVLGASDLATTHAHGWISAAPFVLSILSVAVAPWLLIVWA